MPLRRFDRRGSGLPATWEKNNARLQRRPIHPGHDPRDGPRRREWMWLPPHTRFALMISASRDAPLDDGPYFRIARRLLDAETPDVRDPTSVAAACRAVLARLYEVLKPMLGAGGYETVLGRAVVMSTESTPALGQIGVPRSGPPSESDLVLCLDERGNGNPADAATRLISCFLQFQARLVGTELTSHLLRASWPDSPAELDVPSVHGPPEHRRARRANDRHA